MRKAPVWVWLTVGIGVVGLVIAYMSYRASASGGSLSSIGATPATPSDPTAGIGTGGGGSTIDPGGSGSQPSTPGTGLDLSSLLGQPGTGTTGTTGGVTPTKPWAPPDIRNNYGAIPPLPVPVGTGYGQPINNPSGPSYLQHKGGPVAAIARAVANTSGADAQARAVQQQRQQDAANAVQSVAVHQPGSEPPQVLAQRVSQKWGG